MDEYNIKVSEALNNKLPCEEYLKVIPICDRVISIRVSDYSYFYSYNIIKQTKYIFVDGKLKGEVFIIDSKIDNIHNNLPDKRCYDWKII